MGPTVHTARLVLTPVGDHDLAPLHAHWNDPQVARWLWDANPVPLQTVADLIARSTQTFQTAGWGLWAIRPATAAPLIGACGLSRFEPAPGIELLYSLAPTHWSRGLATEAATAVLAHAFDTLALPEVHATTDDPNTASLRVLHHLGATPTGRLHLGDRTHPSFVIRPGMLPTSPCSSMDRATDF
jgi:[ribosomal protein S5]-alanine N-acetyltransferase